MPPTLGAILTIVLWRFALIPLIVLYIVYGFRKIPSTKAYLQDPAFVSIVPFIALHRVSLIDPTRHLLSPSRHSPHPLRCPMPRHTNPTSSSPPSSSRFSPASPSPLLWLSPAGGYRTLWTLTW